MGKLQEFLNILEEQAKNHSIYVWGAQGQDKSIITEKWIKSRETSTRNATRALNYWKKQVQAGYGDVLRAFDCSGLGIWTLQKMGIIKTDMTANGMKGKCTPISKSELQKGDWVFRVNSSGKATHIGYVVDDNLNVIEAMGRDNGVVKRTLNASGTSYWNAFGRPSYFASEINGQVIVPESFDISRMLKYTTPYMKGDDVKWLQKTLSYAGYSCGSIDGIFGKNTMNAVKKYQKAKKLTVDGIVGEKTVLALGGVWKSNANVKDNTPTVTWVVSRNLKKGCKGNDVKDLQTALIKEGYSCGSKGADGDFGINTYNAVRTYQKASGLTVDGVAGKNTITALGGVWKK